MTSTRVAGLLLSAGFLAIALANCVNKISESDSGPPNAVAAIRHDLPILLEDPLGDENVKPIVDMVVANRYEAVATWHAGKYRGLVVLHRDEPSGQWWWRAATSSDDTTANAWAPPSVPGTFLVHCDELGLRGPPSGSELSMQGLITPVLAARLSDRLKREPSSDASEDTDCVPSPGYIEDERTHDGYVADFSQNGVPNGSFIFFGRAPKGWERPTKRGATLLYEFTYSASRPATARFQSGATFAVWFPFVLDHNSRYVLSLVGTDPALQPVIGNLKNNVLTFTIPTFILPEGRTLYGEIDKLGHT